MALVLEQRHGPFFKRRYEIADNEIVITDRRLAGGGTSRFQIFELSDKTEREISRRPGWLAAAAIAAIPAGLFIKDAISMQATFPLVPAGFFLVCSLALSMMYFYQSYDKIIFNNWQTGKWMFVIWNNKPNKAAFDAFYEALVEEIRKTRVNPRISPEQRLDIYAKQLQFLVEETVLSADEARKILERKERSMKQEKAPVVSIASRQA